MRENDAWFGHGSLRWWEEGGLTSVRRGMPAQHLCPQRLERCSQLFGEVPGLFPCREVAALGEAVVVQELRERAFGPTLRRRVVFTGIRAHADGYGDAFGVKEARLRHAPEFPVKPG